MKMRKYKILWRSGVVEDNIWIHDGAVYTWEEVKKILVEYPDEYKGEQL